MLNSPVIRILRTVSADELRDIKEFISSPYFNKNENVIRLFNYLKKFHPDYRDANLEKEIIYRKLFDKGEYNDGFMRTLVFNLTRLLEEYLAYINFSRNKVRKGINLLSELNERKIEKVFMKNYKAVNSLNESSHINDAQYFMNKFDLTHLREANDLWNKTEQSKEFSKEFQKAYEYITYFYLTTILREYRYLYYLRNFTPAEEQIEFLDSIFDFLSNKNNTFIENPYINLHLNEILLQRDKSAKHFFILKDILRKSKDTISAGDRFSLQNILQIYCINKIFEGRQEFQNERMDLFNIVLEQKLFSPVSEDIMEVTLFGNMVNFGIARGDLNWVEKLIADFKDKIPELYRDSLVNYAYAKLRFEKKDFTGALSDLNSIAGTIHEQMKFPIRLLNMQTLFELNHMEQVFYQIDSTRHYISNNKDSFMGERRERAMNFLKFFNKLSKLREKMNHSELRKLKDELNKTTNANERTWLLKKYNQLSVSCKS